MDLNKLEIKRILCDIDIVTDALYRQDVKPAYEKLNPLLSGLTLLLDQIYQELNVNNAMDFDFNHIMLKLSEALQAMEERDTVLLADILKYEIAEQLNEYITHSK